MLGCTLAGCALTGGTSLAQCTVFSNRSLALLFAELALSELGECPLTLLFFEVALLFSNVQLCSLSLDAACSALIEMTLRQRGITSRY